MCTSIMTLIISHATAEQQHASIDHTSTTVMACSLLVAAPDCACQLNRTVVAKSSGPRVGLQLLHVRRVRASTYGRLPLMFTSLPGTPVPSPKPTTAPLYTIAQVTTLTPICHRRMQCQAPCSVSLVIFLSMPRRRREPPGCPASCCVGTTRWARAYPCAFPLRRVRSGAVGGADVAVLSCAARERCRKRFAVTVTLKILGHSVAACCSIQHCIECLRMGAGCR